VLRSVPLVPASLPRTRRRNRGLARAAGRGVECTHACRPAALREHQRLAPS